MTQATLTQQFETAKQLFVKGKLTEAGVLCEKLVAANANHQHAWFLLACVYQRLGHADDAITSIQNATRIAPFEPGFHAQAGEIFQEAGKTAEAEASLRYAVKLNPQFHQAYNGLGILLVDLKRPDEAIEAFKKALEIQPRYAIAHNNLGTALVGQGRLADAAAHFERAIAARPAYVAALYSLATLKLHGGDRARAFELLQAALNAKPGHVEAHFLIAGLHADAGSAAAALTHYREAIRLKPGEIAYVNRLAEFLWQLGDFDAALAMYRHAVSIAPANLKANLCANLLLPPMLRDVADLEASRARFAAGLAALERDIPALLGNTLADLERDIQWDNFYLAYQGGDDRGFQVRYAALMRKVLERLAPDLFTLPSRKRAPQARLRIGFVSHNFYDCTVGNYFQSWITDLDHDKFETFVYHLNPHSDSLTARIRAASAAFADLASKPLSEVAHSIAADEPDVLIYPELGMHPLVFCLASFRLAPLQCAGWGHPVTSGHANVDYFLSCADMEPDAADLHYSEKLVRLPGLGTRYEMPPVPPAGARADFELPEERILYLVPQSLYKIHPDNDELIADVIAAEPRAVAVLFAPDRQDVVKRIFAERMAGQFERRGIDPEGRIWMLPRVSREDYLRICQLCDVMLDTLHWSGGNTSLDAIACGLPIVTLPGAYMRGRQSLAMLRALGCDELIARDRDDYVATALRLGRDAALRGEVSKRILAARGALFSRSEPLRKLEAFLLDTGRHG